MTPRRGFGLSLLAAILAGLGVFFWPRPPQLPPVLPPTPSLLAVWPWPRAALDTPHPGVTHWLDTSSPDGTMLDFFDFDFGKNPHLRFEIYDQDEDDVHPFDDYADCWPHGVGWAVAHLNARHQGKVVAAWHGLFFNCDASGHSADPRAIYVGHHVTPVVLRGKAHCNVGEARWTFGAKYDALGRPTFKTLLLPDKVALEKNFTFAAGGAQCLIRDGRPQTLLSFASAQDPFAHHPLVCAVSEAGYIPNGDWIQTSRATMAWSRDQKHFYLLFVKQTGTEGGGVMASHGHGPPVGGWTVSDEQKFWLAHGGIWGAINSDGGDVAQLTYALPDGNYMLLPSQDGGYYQQRLIIPPSFPDAPPGGTLLYFTVQDTAENTPP